MEILLKRRWFNDKATIGEMFLDGDVFRQCYTLEDYVRKDGEKVPGKTAIPEGRYEVVLNYSNRFKRIMPRLMNVPNFEGILIHSGNTDADTEGCILTGRVIVNNMCIGESRLAFSELFSKMESAAKHGKIWIEIKNTGVES